MTVTAPVHTTVHTFIYLQYLRGIAALLVVYFHSVLQLKNLGVVSTGLPLFGESGVDMFFVLSGFLMWITTDRSAITPGAFMVNRLIRIVPLYWALTVAAGVVALLAPEVLKHTKFEAVHFFSSLFFLPSINPSYLDGTSETLKLTPVLVPGWTLNYEMFFYVIFAAVISLGGALRLPAIVFVFLAICAWGGFVDNSDSSITFYGNTIIFEFVFGIIIAMAVRRGITVRPSLALLGALVGIVTVVYSNIIEYPIPRVIVFGIPAALLVYCLCCLERHTRTIKLPLLKALGDASYSLYLTHVFTLVVCRLIFAHLFALDSLWREWLFTLFCMALSSVVALAVYNLYEKPAGIYLKRYRY
jgi:exopolysaccharide production protein ExoZ